MRYSEPYTIYKRSFTIALLVLCALLTGLSRSAQAAQLLNNGSFEVGGPAPAGWRLFEAASWETGVSHSGNHFVSGVSKKDALICESDLLPLRSDAAYRLDGWIKCSEGSARLGVDWLDEQGRVIGQRAAAPCSPGLHWRYVALEFDAAELARGSKGSAPPKPRKGSPPEISARVWFRVKGKAALDEVGFAPAANSFMGNKGLEVDERGRVGAWNEEQNDTLLTGRRAGSFKPDSSVKHGGKSSVLLTATGDWAALGSLNYGLAPWTERYQ